ncbi:MAG: hypothetical protein RIA63_12990 [Cyclobacteriaceae bacterium]
MKRFILFALLTVAITTIQAQDFYQIKNRWKTNEYIHVEQPTPASGAIDQGWWSAQWTFEAVQGSPYYKVKNKWKNQYLHIENGPLALSDIQAAWWSAQWSLEPVAGTNFIRIRNRWKPEIALHNQNGRLEAGTVELGWWSAQWERVAVGSGGSAAPSTPAVANNNAANPPVSNRRNNNPSAFSPEHNGRIVEISVRYTNQIQIPPNVPIKPGDKIYFFPQEMVVRADGLSFDAKNPPIGGQTFTIKSVSPLELDRPMPMMRNRVNDYFGMVVEIY